MLTALQLAEQIDIVCDTARGKNADAIRAMMRQAERLLKEKEKARPLSEDDVRLMMRLFENGKEFAVYIEDRGYYKPMAVIADLTMGNSVRLMYSNGMRYMMDLSDYNRTWRLWDKIPSGVEMKMTEWRARK